MLDRRTVAMFGASLLGACTLSAPQFEQLLESASAAFTNQSSESHDNLWTAETNSQGRVVSLYQRDGMFVFISEEQDVIVFDGWVLRLVSGFGFSSTKKILDEDGLRTYRSRGRSGGSVECAAWRPDQTTAAFLWRQSCAQLPKDNVIMLDAAGDVVSIRQVIDAQGNELFLKRVGWSN
jgi:hypothetical protein